MEIQIPLILFTTLLAWSAGVFGTQAVYALKGKGASTQMLAVIVSLVLLAVGGVAVLFHLQHALRIFNGFGNPTSGITQELVALIILAIFMVIYFIFLCRNNNGRVPKWLSICAIVFGVVLCAVCAHSYMMGSRPAWNTVFQVGSLLAAALGFGPATMAFLCSIKKDKFNALVHKIIKGYTVGVELTDEELEECGGYDITPEELAASDDVKVINTKSNLIGQVVAAVLIVFYIIALSFVGNDFTVIGYYFDPTGPTRGITDTSAISPWFGEALPVTIVTIIAIAASVAAAVMGKKTGNWKRWGLIAVIAVLVLAFCVRVLFYILGVSVYPFTDL